jgi:3'(2'), 5'-bisphosphate nucleotidase
MSDAELAAQLAAKAGELLLALRAQGRLEGKALGAEGDARANALLLAGLAAARPEDAVLSEESQDDPSRLDAGRVWIVDPLDGTREYGEGRSDWAVHVALTEGGVPVAGAVALPGQSLVLRSDQPLALPPHASPLRMLVSRTRPAPEAREVAVRLGAELVPMGSAGAKAMAVVLGQADIYLHSGGQYEWDSCAPVAVALAHGLHCSRLDGTPLVYNRADTYMPDLLICHREHALQLLAMVREISSPPAP